MSMSYRENLVRAMKRNHPEFIPFEFSFVAPLAERLKKETGCDNLEEYFNRESYHARMGIKNVAAAPTRNPNDYRRYFAALPYRDELIISEWGSANRPGDFMHFTHMESPLKNASSLRDIEKFTEPDVDAPYRWVNARKQVDKLHAQGYAVTGFSGHTFETAWQIRGMEEFLADMYLNKSWCECLNARIALKNLECVKYIVGAGADVLRLGDDVGMQTGMMFSPELWRELYKPWMKKYIETAKGINPDILVWYHSDGKIYDIIPDLIEIGLDILNPVQPECMDPFELKKKYGNKLSFWGVIGTQTTMPFASAKEVKDTVKNYIKGIGKDGGLCLAPTHVLEPEVPLENINAMMDAIEEYGRY